MFFFFIEDIPIKFEELIIINLLLKSYKEFATKTFDVFICRCKSTAVSSSQVGLAIDVGVLGVAPEELFDELHGCHG